MKLTNRYVLDLLELAKTRKIIEVRRRKGGDKSAIWRKRWDRDK